MTEKNKRAPRIPDAEKLLNRLAGLCSRSEQCSADIIRKLDAAGVGTADAQSILARLKSLGFVDDRRYARSFAADKVRFSAWGRIKIRAHLMQHRIPADMIAEALGSISPEEYKEAFLRALKARGRTLDLHSAENRDKLMRHLLSRGFEPQLCLRGLEAVRKRLES